MLNQIRLFFDEHIKLPAPEETSAEQLQIASAALLLEMVTMDDKIEAIEQEAVSSLVQQRFSLTPEQASTLSEMAEQQRKESVDYYQFTSLINKSYNLDQKIELIESLREIAFVDGDLDMHEEYLVRKIADLLYVPHA
ncbi:hypothetical protein BJAS_P3196 [Bathymodiolus japonicus methanotrophic gill symbiont]|uniref:tellurite resistance TerB family protein n=1 Tax=Bathymodiolus japonicus methanotrophic gill symbiont TaxID=113269 RepID=UPI001B425E43|nr:TerB family tellurite resistance protein [Bathymodiolus japonicus methanotrophic gill symbiont]GFO72722.1 hypothetical protein BJAS_P3196 [Bathymodiolus japonicus methanotrophic gill symbiont]